MSPTQASLLTVADADCLSNIDSYQNPTGTALYANPLLHTSSVSDFVTFAECDVARGDLMHTFSLTLSTSSQECDHSPHTQVYAAYRLIGRLADVRRRVTGLNSASTG